MDVDFDDARASLRVRGLGVFDDHDLTNSLTDGLGLPGDLGFSYPQIPGVFPTRASVSFDVEWNGIVSAAQIHNTAQRFQGSFLETNATIEWSSEQPGFRFQSEAANPARNLISVLGTSKTERSSLRSVSFGFTIVERRRAVRMQSRTRGLAPLGSSL